MKRSESGGNHEKESFTTSSATARRLLYRRSGKILWPYSLCGRPKKEITLKFRKGFTLIELMIVIAIIAIIAAIAIPNLLAARKQGNEAAAIGALKTITTSQSLYREGDKDGNATLDYGTLTNLATYNLIDSVLGAGTKQGYFFQASPSTTTTEFLWYAAANPAVPTTTGDRYFMTNHEGVIFYTTGSTIAAGGVVDAATCEHDGTLLPVGR